MDAMHPSYSSASLHLHSPLLKMFGFIRSFRPFLYSVRFIKTSSIFYAFVSLLFFAARVHSLSFSFPRFEPNTENIVYMNSSTAIDGVIQLTRDSLVSELQFSVGRASYSQPIRLWDRSTNEITNFTTHFSFNITPLGDPNTSGDGIAFFIAPFDDSTESAPENSGGACLGLVGDPNYCNVTSTYPFVAVEFDSFRNFWDPSNDHIGIDVNSVVSEATITVTNGLKNRTTAHAWINYDSLTQNLSVFLTYDGNHVFGGESNLSYIINLSSILPETVRVGFSAATGTYFELHSIFSWDFNSTLADANITPPAPSNQPPIRTRQSNSNAALIGGLVAGISALIIVLGSVTFIWWRWKSGAKHDDINFDMDDDFDQDTGPKRFTYNELSHATNNFHEDGKLGQGGFGAVYRGNLTNLSREIAVKKISRGSKQGKKEYVSEVKTISRLRHKNLVQLLGWCHERGHLLLVYEFMPNGSLDSHLYTGKRKVVLPWVMRYKIAQDLASALLYLHEEWEQCVLHRDIKSSNVMLDSNFNARLGDFGLARLVDHNLGSQTTVLAGTVGYLAPECVMSGKASKESDVYSFGVVALEISCGRPPIVSKEEPIKVSTIEWVWHLYGEGSLLEAVDKRLEGEFDVQQMECLMIVGLWCCHPEYTFRPSIRQVISVLNSESPLPNNLPIKFPVPIYCTPPTNVEALHISSSSGFTGSSTGTTSSSSQSAVCGTLHLLSEKENAD